MDTQNLWYLGILLLAELAGNVWKCGSGASGAQVWRRTALGGNEPWEEGGNTQRGREGRASSKALSKTNSYGEGEELSGLDLALLANVPQP